MSFSFRIVKHCLRAIFFFTQNNATLGIRNKAHYKQQLKNAKNKKLFTECVSRMKDKAQNEKQKQRSTHYNDNPNIVNVQKKY